ncbi:unnamed protein product [Paramecium primaurelia]|uniref:PWWP domain-containing protein n=1 Tax=Paramecium primaurelia TaxID=5886 RepID=A0A8S1Q0I7_PARPR|nr:unnamed protein product [Paramecium primaurelia]
MKSSLKKKQIVWARTKGHPWWPGIITQVFDGNQYAINFIGDDSQQGSILMSDNLFDFQEKFEEFNDKVKKNKKLKEAIQNAQKLQKKQKKKHSDSEQEDKKKSIISKRNLRKQLKKPETPNKDNIQKSPQQETPQMQQKKQYLDREFQDLLLLLIAAQLNYDQIKQKLTPILDTIEAQVAQNSTITEVLSERKGSILNAVYLILKHQSEQNPDHFFQRDIHQQITRLHELISKLKNSLLNQFFNAANIIQNLSEVCFNGNRGQVFTTIMNQDKINEKKIAQVSQTASQKHAIENLQQTKRQKKKEKTEQKIQSNNGNVQIPENTTVQNSNNNNNNTSNQSKKDQITNEESKIEEKKNNTEQTKIIKQDIVVQKKLQKKNEIPDQALRRKVCLNMLELVQLLGMEEEEAKKITIKIESLGREADPLMRNKYAKLMWHCIVNLDSKLLKREELLNLIDENADQSDVWTKLTLQPIDRTRKLIHI